MVTAHARIPTDRAGRYLVQLCRHAAMIGAGSHAPNGHRSARSDMHVVADWSESAGTITFDPWGHCVLTATADSLDVHIDAADNGHLHKIEDIIGNNLERMSHRNPLAVQWIHEETPIPSGTETGGRTPKPPRRSKVRIVVIAVVVAMFIGAHFLLGGSLATDLRLTGAAGLLALGLLIFKLATMALAGRGLMALGRGNHRRLAAELHKAPL